MIPRSCRLFKSCTARTRQYHTISNERSLRLLQWYGIPVPRYLVAHTPTEAVQYAAELHSPDFTDSPTSELHKLTPTLYRSTASTDPPKVVLVPVSTNIQPNAPAAWKSGLVFHGHAGRRPSVILELANTMLNETIMASHAHAPRSPFEPDLREPLQDNDYGEEKRIMVSEYHDVSRRHMVAITIDRKECCPILIVSRRSHIDLETMLLPEGRNHTAKFKLPWGKEHSAIPTTIMKKVQEHLRLPDEEAESLQPHIQRAYNLFRNRNAILVEMNPISYTKSQEWYAMNARIVLDSSALYKNSFLKPPPSEAEEMAFVKLQSPTATIGTIVNGAGLAMATNDAIKSYGGEAANFCDFGGRATDSTILAAFKRVLEDERVNTILVNVYGGITRGDMIAKAILRAVDMAGDQISDVPIVVRLAGTGATVGMNAIRNSGLALYAEDTFEGAAKKAIQLSKHGEGRLLQQSGRSKHQRHPKRQNHRPIDQSDSKDQDTMAGGSLGILENVKNASTEDENLAESSDGSQLKERDLIVQYPSRPSFQSHSEVEVGQGKGWQE